MRTTQVVLATFAVLAFAACGRSAPQTPAPIPPLAIDARVFYDDDVGIRDSTTAVIRDRATLEDVWQRVTSTRASRTALSEVPDLAGVQFDRQMLLLVTAGRLVRGDEVHIDSVGRRREVNAAGRQQEVLLVHFTVTEGCRRFTDAAYPLEIVRVARYEGEVRFNGKRERTTTCR